MIGMVGLALLLGATAPDDGLGLRVAPGFRVSVFADERLADDTYAMTLDARGRVVVTTRGSVRTLHDDDGDGRADRTTTFCETPSGGMGLCFDGDDLLLCADGWLSLYRDADGDGRADGPPRRIIPLKFAEHGGHAMRRGPDGWWYVIAGNDAEVGARHATSATSQITRPEAGAILRLPPSLRTCEVVAHGFRNPYDFDFNPAGDLFTYDSDVERDAGLPWYSPTRLYHVAVGGHHGWRLTGFMRSWARKPDYLDTVDVLWPVGRGSPTGVACYRHTRFPPRYRGGVFALDWTFGKVYYFPLTPAGSSYRTEPEVFLEPVGTHGFDPTDVAIGPDGELYISIGGRRTRGAVYRVEPIDRPARRPEPSGLDAVLGAPQPLDAWSRARWEPIARRLGPVQFAEVIRDERRPEPERVRAVEVMTERFGGLDAETARAGARAASPAVRARVAWSLGVAGAFAGGDLIDALARDGDVRVRLAALEALATRFGPEDGARAIEPLAANLGLRDKRVRQAAARLAARLSAEDWARLVARLEGADVPTRLGGALAAAWRSAEPGPLIAPARDGLASADDRLDALRLLQLAVGDYRLDNPPVEVFTAYAPARPVGPEAAAPILAAVRGIFPSGPGRDDEEAARFLAMLEDEEPATLRKVASFWTRDSPPTRDVHYLVVAARLGAPRDAALTDRVASALLGLDRKFEGRQLRIKQSWSDRFAELATALIAKDARLAGVLLAHPDLPRPAHVPLAAALGPADRPRAARRFWDAARGDPEYPWSAPLIEMFALLPPAEVRPALRERWEDLGLRDAILEGLARHPDEADRSRFLAGLDSPQPKTVAACLDALDRLPRDDDPTRMVPLLRLLRRLRVEPGERALRERAVAVLGRQAGRRFDVVETKADPASLARAQESLFGWFERAHPAFAPAARGRDEASQTRLAGRLRAVDWSAGDPARGEALYRSRGCATCHAGPSRIGPDLAGVSTRLSREDLFAALDDPSREVAPPYRVTLFETRDGRVVAGIVAFESADGVIVQTGTAGTVRLATSEIAARQPSRRSLMPDGLLDGLSPRDLADLDRFLRSDRPR